LSYTFEMSVPKAPPFGPLLLKLKLADLRCTELIDDESGDPAFVDKFPHSLWPPGVLHLFREKLSTRGIEVESNAERMSVRLMTLSSHEDFLLGFSVLELIAQYGDGVVHSEEGDSFPISELRSRFNSEWIRNQNDTGVSAMIALSAQGDDVTLPGVIRNAYLGPRIIKELQSCPKDKRVERTLSMLLAVQFPGPDWFAASVMEVKSKGAPKAFTCSVLGPDVSYLFGPVEFLMIETAPKQYLFLPYEHLDTVACEHSVALDEKNRLVRKFSSTEWGDFVSRAEQYRVYPTGNNAEDSDRKWWQFWR
jgi:hypothetical protein